MKSPRTPPAAITGRTMRRAAAASLIALAGMTATAATATAAGPAPAGIALMPGGTADRLEFDTRPGSVVEGTVRVKNGGGSSRAVRLSAVDLGTASFGGAVYGQSAAKKAGKWMRLERRTVTVPARSMRTVRFRVSVPAGARSGVHYAGVTASDAAELRAARTSGGGKKKSIVFHRILRMALPIKLELPGAASPRLRLRGAKVRVDAVGTQVQIGIENAGGTLIRSTGVNLRITKGSRTIMTGRQPMTEFVPGTSTAYPLTIPGVPAAGDYRVVGRITPAGGPAMRVDEIVHINGKTIAKARRSLDGRARVAPARGGISPMLWLAVGGLGAIAAALAIGFARMRRRLKEATAGAAAQRA
ncbi:MAG: hypothetical protein QOJ57_1016 [Thermoleophilaceae bacterium]|nr:hypothetical protein [Thermoleophilaceae bacterium]